MNYSENIIIIIITVMSRRRHLQGVSQKGGGVLLSEHCERLHSHVVDESGEGVQVLQDPLGSVQLLLQFSLLSHVDVMRLTAWVWLFGRLYLP